MGRGGARLPLEGGWREEDGGTEPGEPGFGFEVILLYPPEGD